MSNQTPTLTVTFSSMPMETYQNVSFDCYKQQLKRFSDIGSGREVQWKSLPAEEAIVFMLLGLCYHWNAPIAYSVTKSLSDQLQENLYLRIS